MEGGRVDEEVPPHVEKVEQVLQDGKGVQGDKLLLKVIMPLMWKEVMRFRSCVIG